MRSEISSIVKKSYLSYTNDHQLKDMTKNIFTTNQGPNIRKFRTMKITMTIIRKLAHFSPNLYINRTVNFLKIGRVLLAIHVLRKIKDLSKQKNHRLESLC